MDCICRGINSRDTDVIITLYSVFFRLHLEYCAQFWSPQFKRCRKTGKFPKEGHKDCQRGGEPALEDGGSLTIRSTWRRQGAIDTSCTNRGS